MTATQALAGSPNPASHSSPRFGDRAAWSLQAIWSRAAGGDIRLEKPLASHRSRSLLRDADPSGRRHSIRPAPADARAANQVSWTPPLAQLK